MKKIKVFLSTVPFLFAPIFAADYTDCAKFFNPFNPSPELEEKINFPVMGGFGARIGGGMNGVHPFTMGKDGKIVAADWTKSYNRDDKSGNETIEYDQPIFKYKGGFKIGEQPNFDLDKKRVKVQITRDADGNITSVYNDYNVTKKELEENNEIMLQWKNKIYNPKYLKEIEEINKKMGVKDEDFAFIPVGNRFNLSILGGKNGKCRVDGAEFDFLTQNKIDGKKMTTTTFNTETCNDISKALKQYKKQVENCSDPEANNAISKIATKYYKNNPNKGTFFYPGMGMMGGAGMGYGMPIGTGNMGTGMGMGVGGGLMNPSFDILMGPLVSVSGAEGILGASSPLLAAIQVSQYCAIYGVTPFMNDQYFPSAKTISPTAGTPTHKK